MRPLSDSTRLAISPNKIRTVGVNTFPHNPAFLILSAVVKTSLASLDVVQDEGFGIQPHFPQPSRVRSEYHVDI